MNNDKIYITCGQSMGEFAYNMKQLIDSPKTTNEDKKELEKIFNEWHNGYYGKD